MAEAVTRDPANIRMVKERSQVRGEERRQVFSNCFFQVIFCWTDEDNTRETVLNLKKLGVDGVIYDRMDQNKTFVASGR